MDDFDLSKKDGGLAVGRVDCCIQESIQQLPYAGLPILNL